MCPQVLQAGASLCIFFAAAFTISNPASALILVAARCNFCGCTAGVVLALGAVTRMLLNSGVLVPK
jgi:hypothetical protein